MRLLFVMNSAHYFCLNRMGLAKAAQRDGWEVHVAVVQDDPKSCQEIIDAGMQLHPWQLSRRGFGILSTLQSLLKLWQLIHELKPDLVHSLTIKPVILSGLLCRFRQIPMVALIAGRGHSFDGPPWLRWMAKTLYSWALKGADTRVAFQNPSDRELFLELGMVQEDKVRLIPGSGVDMERFAYRPYRQEADGERVILLASRMLRQKGILDYMRAAQIAKGKLPGLRFLLVGAPDPGNPHSFTESELLTLCEEFGVEYLGFRRDIDRVLAQCDIFCLPTYYGEGIPMTLMQAASLGKLVIASDVPGCREVVIDGETGLRIPPRQPERLAKAVLLAAESPELCTRLAAQCHQHLKAHFEASVIHRAYLELYQELLVPSQAYQSSPSSVNS